MLKRSLSRKLALWLLLATAIPFLISNYITYRSTSDSIGKQMIEMNRRMLEISMDQVTRYIEDLHQDLFSWYYDEQLFQDIKADKPEYSRFKVIDDRLSSLFNTRREIVRVNFHSYITGKWYWKEDYQFSLDYRELAWMDGHLPGTNGYRVQMVNGKPTLKLTHSITEYPKKNKLGQLSLSVSIEEMIEIHEKLYSKNNGELMFLFVGRHGGALYSTPAQIQIEDLRSLLSIFQSEKNNGYKEVNFRGRDGLAIYHKVVYRDEPLTMIKFIPDDKVTETAENILEPVFVIQVVTLILMILFTVLLSLSFIAPIKRLIRNVARIEQGDFRIELAQHRQDEFGMLERRFQKLTDTLRETIFQKYQLQIEMYRAQVRMLQAQINPHFLYNTLQSIGTLALRHRLPDIHDRITELGAIMRYAMDMKQEVVQLKQEFQYIEDYLSLQRGRFPGKLEYEMEADSAALSAMVPKMILQPLVENSVVHGIEGGNGRGRIMIAAKLNDDTMIVEIVDTGKGFPPEVIRTVQAAYQDESPIGTGTSGIGLLNVLLRMKLKFGERFTWHIQSIPYERNVITLQWSLKEEEQ